MRAMDGGCATVSGGGRFRVFGLGTCWVAACLFFLAGPAEGQGRRPCGAEIQKLCPELEAGTAPFRECADEHSEQLSPECRERLERGREKIDRMREACALELETHCGDIEPGGGNFLRCLHEHRDDLSENCAQGLPRGRRPGDAPGKAPSPAPADEPVDE